MIFLRAVKSHKHKIKYKIFLFKIVSFKIVYAVKHKNIILYEKKIKKNGEIAPVGFEPTKANAATS